MTIPIINLITFGIGCFGLGFSIANLMWSVGRK
jgi:hypothetical protein